MEQQANRAHRQKKEKKKPSEGRNPKAFAYSHPGVGERQARRSDDRRERRLHVPLVDRLPDEAPPLIAAVMGPPGVGKTTLIKSLVRRYTKHTLSVPTGPLTVVSSKKRRLTLIEVPSDSLASMIDAAKVADLIILLIDGNFGFEMETMEFLNVLAATGMPGNVLGVLTHLDFFKKASTLKDAKKRLKHRFWKELWPGAKLFYLSGVLNGRYPDREIHNLSRFISIQKNPRPLIWRNSHPYCLADRFLDITSPTAIEANPKCDRTVALYGYLRGTNFAAAGGRVHVPGIGDLAVSSVEALSDPCPSPYAEQVAAKQAGKKIRKRLGEKQKLLFAPMSDVGGVLVDSDAVYIDIKTSTFDKENNGAERGFGEQMMVDLQGGKRLLGEADDGVRLFRGAHSLINEAEDAGRRHLRSGAVSQRDVGDDEMPEQSDSEDQGSFSGESEVDEELAGAPVPKMLGTSRKLEQEGHKDAGNLAFAESDSDLGSISSDDDQVLESGASDVDEDGEGSESADDADDDFGELRWKTDLHETARKLHGAKRKVRTTDLARMLYDTSITPAEVAKRWRGTEEPEMVNGEEKEDDDFFKKSTQREVDDALYDGQTIERYNYTALAEKWSNSEQLEELRQRFTSAHLTNSDGNNNDESGEFEGVDSASEGDGDFEDLEAGDGNMNGVNGKAEEEAPDADVERERNARKKEELKLRFEEEDREGFFNDKSNAEREGADEEFGVDEWYDAQKARIQKQLDINQSEMANLDPASRVRVEGHRPGTYARVVLQSVPYEFSVNFNPRFPLVVGGLAPTEERMGFVQVRIKRHRWHRRVLKSNDPLIISLGWRRFQTLPIYSTSDSRTRNRMLKYTPEHMHCFGTFWGPLVAPNTGFCAVQSLSNATPHFRVAATGVVLDVDADAGGGGPGPLVKKLKLTGEPHQVFRNTAFIRGMFNSALEIAKFEGASLRTVSGVRGQIKRALHRPEGVFRATFEDKILMSDIVFLRAWYPVRPHRFYNPVTNLLSASTAASNASKEPTANPVATTNGTSSGDASAEASAPSNRTDPDASWIGMRTAGALRAELALPTPDNPNSRYRAIERPTRVFNPLRVPSKLAADLPFGSQAMLTPKRSGHGQRKPYVLRRAVLEGGEEKKMRAMMSMLGSLRREKDEKAAAKKEAQRKVYRKKVEESDAKRAARERREKDEFWRREGKKRKNWSTGEGATAGGGGKRRRQAE